MYLEGGIDSPLGGKLIVAEVIKDGAAARSGKISSILRIRVPHHLNPHPHLGIDNQWVLGFKKRPNTPLSQFLGKSSGDKRPQSNPLSRENGNMRATPYAVKCVCVCVWGGGGIRCRLPRASDFFVHIQHVQLALPIAPMARLMSIFTQIVSIYLLTSIYTELFLRLTCVSYIFHEFNVIYVF